MTINHCKKINQNVIGWVIGCDGIMGDIPPHFYNCYHYLNNDIAHGGENKNDPKANNFVSFPS